MKLPVISTENKEMKSIELPLQFSEPVHADLILRAVLALQSSFRTPYGSDPEAGKKASAKISRRRRNYKGAYGKGISRVPRKTVSRSGARFSWVGAFAPGTVGGRRAHPPKAEKSWDKKVNKKETRKAIRSALSAAMLRELVSRRHRVPQNYPFVLDSGFEGIAKTKEARKALVNIGLGEELVRCSQKKIRAGRGKMRGRRYVRKKGPLIVVSNGCSLLRSARNIPGVEIVQVSSLNAVLLAPGGFGGRMALFTEAAIERVEKERLFA